jgi:CRP/FNR family transcriptional regulator
MDWLPRLKPHGTERRFPAGQVLIEQGQPAPGMFYLIEGRVTHSVLSAAGESRLLAIVEPGCLFGEMAALDGSPTQTRAVAATDGQALFLNARGLAQLIRTDGEFAYHFSLSMARKLRMVVKQVADMTMRPAPDQLSCLLHQMARQKGPDHPGSPRVTLPASHQQLADMLGASRVTVSQGLTALKERGLVETGHRVLYILNPDGLRCCGHSPYCVKGTGTLATEAGD